MVSVSGHAFQSYQRFSELPLTGLGFPHPPPYTPCLLLTSGATSKCLCIGILMSSEQFWGGRAFKQWSLVEDKLGHLSSADIS